MPRLSSRMLAGLTLAGAVVGLLLSPFLGAAYLATEEAADQQALVSWDEPFRDALGGAFTFASPDDVYLMYGRVVTVALLSFLAGLVLLRRQTTPDPSRYGTMVFRTLLTLQSIMVVALLVLFYLALVDPIFFVAFPAMLLSMVAYILYGIHLVRRRLPTPGAGWWLIAGGGLFMPLAIVLGHNSIGFGLLNAGYIALGLRSLRLPDESAGTGYAMAVRSEATSRQTTPRDITPH